MSVYPPLVDFEHSSVLLFFINASVELTPNLSVFSLWGTQPEKAVKKNWDFFFFFA